MLFPIIHFPRGGHKAPISKVFSKGASIPKGLLAKPQALTLLESAKQCQPRPLFPRDASLHSVSWSDFSPLQGPGPSAQCPGWVPAGRFLSQHGHGTGLNELLAKGLLLNTNTFLMTKVIHAHDLKIYIQPKKKGTKKKIPRKCFSSNPDTSWKVYTVNSFLCLFSEIF